jgi:hypothetical protein
MNRNEEDDAFDREYVVHGDGEYADGEVYVNTCESHCRVSDAWLSPIDVSLKISRRSISKRFKYTENYIET